MPSNFDIGHGSYSQFRALYLTSAVRITGRAYYNQVTSFVLELEANNYGGVLL